MSNCIDVFDICEPIAEKAIKSLTVNGKIIPGEIYRKVEELALRKGVLRQFSKDSRLCSMVQCYVLEMAANWTVAQMMNPQERAIFQDYLEQLFEVSDHSTQDALAACCGVAQYGRELPIKFLWVSDSLWQAIKSTDLGRFDLQNIKVPASSICLIFPKKIQIGPGVKVEGVLLRDIQEDGGDKLMFNILDEGVYRQPMFLSKNELIDNKKNLVELFALVAKLLVFLNTPSAQIKEGEVSRSGCGFSQEKKKINEVWGPNILGFRQTRDSDSQAQGRHPRAHLVRGHFHRYKCGKGKTETKINWIQPYWKCIDDEA